MFDIITDLILQFLGELPIYVLIFIICSFIGRGVRS